MAENSKIFADGLIYKAPREGAPEYIKGSLSIKVADFSAFLEAHNTNSGWVNIDIKESKSGKLYCELNTYKPEKPQSVKDSAPIEYPNEEENSNDVPF